jgi:hypothetical protein
MRGEPWLRGSLTGSKNITVSRNIKENTVITLTYDGRGQKSRPTSLGGLPHQTLGKDSPERLEAILDARTK